MRTTRIRPIGAIGLACVSISALCIGVMAAGAPQDTQVKLSASATPIDKDGKHDRDRQDGHQ